jgi:hypothetical protein
LTKEIKNKVADKTRLRNQIENLEVEISNLSSKYRLSNSDSGERSSIETQLESAVNQKKNKIVEYNSVLSSLNLIYKENPIDRIRPKYRVRGFWEIPSPQYDSRTGNQEVVQFNVQYRYLSQSGKQAETQELSFNESGNVQTGIFSNWNEIKTEPRKKYYDLNEDKFIFNENNVKDVSQINVNQLDIPITPGESVEFRIQSVSEAGYPSNPLLSSWSASTVIKFPEELNSEIDLYSVLEESAREEERALILNQLQNYDLERHVRSSRLVNNRYFSHDANEIDSGLQDSNGKILSVEEELRNLRNQIESIKNEVQTQIQNPVEIKSGTMEVYIEGKDRKGNNIRYSVKNGSTVELQPPSYFDIIQKLPKGDRRGAVIKENYNLVIHNTGNGNLQLNSKFPGATFESLPTIQGSNLIWRGSSFFDDDYKLLRRYDMAPVRYSSFKSYNEIKDNSSRFGYGYQMSSQVSGQFIYARYKDLSGTKTLFLEGDQLKPTQLPSQSNTFGNKKSFIWDGNWYNPTVTAPNELNPYTMAPTGNGILNEFKVIDKNKNPDCWICGKKKQEKNSNQTFIIEK